MRIKKVDANQPEIVRQLRKIPGVSVAHIHTVGEGVPDLIAGYKGVTYLLEVKDPSKPPSSRKLTPEEQKFHKAWTGQIAVIETLSDFLKIINL